MSSSNKPQAAPTGLATRFGAVQGYFVDHVNVRQYMPVFIALEPSLAEHTETINRLWNRKAAFSVEMEPIIARMERVVEVLKNAKAVA